MRQRPRFRRFRWLLLLAGVALAGGLWRFTGRPAPHRPPTKVLLPKKLAKPRPRVPAVAASLLGSEEHLAAVGDFDGDGHLDLALTNGDDSPSHDPQGTVSLWLGNGRGGLRHAPALEGIEASLLATLDADGDGDDDLLAGSCCDDLLLLWRNEGPGRLVPTRIPVSASADDLAVGDLDGDGDPDIVLPQRYQYEIGTNDGQGRFAWRLLEPQSGPMNPGDLLEKASLVDVDGDHDLDLLSISGKGSVLFNDGKGGFGHEEQLPSVYCATLALGDLDGDGAPDLAVTDGQEHVTLMLNNGHGGFGAAGGPRQLTYPVRFGVEWVGLADVDHDGDLDLVLNTLNDVWVQLNDGAAHFDPPYQVDLPDSDSSLEEVLLADMDRDGQPELLVPVLPSRLAARRPNRSTLPTLPRPTRREAYADADQLPITPAGASVETAMAAAMQARLVLPPGYVLTAERATYIVDLEVGADGVLRHPDLQWQSLTPAVDSVMARTLRHLPPFVPARLHGRPVRVRLSLTPRLEGKGPPRSPAPPPPEPPAITPAAEKREAQTWQRGQAQRRPHEAPAAFLGRVLPHTFPLTWDVNELRMRFATAAWRPSAFGPQLFLENQDDDRIGLVVLDPYRPSTYAVQRLPLSHIEGEPTNVAAIFFADANHDGRRELLVLLEANLRDVLSVDKHGRRFYGHATHYRTQVFQYRAPAANGRPRYREDLTSRPYLDELPTAAAVRKALARH
ncbi:FG-GAP-like repeat-containing protein [Hymenobacter sp. M29]|uniref:FG-GAP-like repeat-containing protein n=1 Tax=Hymenobacter mellowenesis TaxID=3063995 RepID=A0ABT9A762_9BACT|nr:FG-GAP-like repeat-containing protein [Hymenobacter sp. M29]MDO7845682.1 FG-GAP-like repeat-containing protein [Hymenobacter sp. M29]